MPAISKIVLGTVQFGLEYGINNISGKPAFKEVESILDLAFENNIRVLDTAEIYGNSQEIIGKYHRTSSNKFSVMTKFSSNRSDLSENLVTRIHQNLKELHVESLYCYMFHSFNDFVTYFDRYKVEIKELKEKQLIEKLGVSVYSNDEIEKILEYDIDLIQLPFNLLDNSNLRSDMISKAKRKGMEIHTRSVFLQGLFFKDSNKLPSELSIMKPYLDILNSISRSGNVSLNDLALNYACSQIGIDHVLVGVDSAEQLRENIYSLNTQISSDIIRQINSIYVKESLLLNPVNWKS